MGYVPRRMTPLRPSDMFKSKMDERLGRSAISAHSSPRVRLSQAGMMMIGLLLAVSLIRSGACSNQDKAVTGYHSMLFTDGQQWWKYKGAANYALGTSLCYRKSWWNIHRFSAKQIGEDGDFAREADMAGQLISVDAGELMIASIHKGNTSPRGLFGDQWQRIEALRQFLDFAIAS